MDYEDNDFQSQSFQLAVEENIKFSPESHSYSLPKFDLDDSLQIHLRFGSLVESEDLLGIRSQEENQWIEDFSRESSGLEFSSGAAESCTISRRNNVWSEATSSESVDLLLKSVGQDEMIIGQSIIEESDNCDGLNSLTSQKKSSLSQVGFSISKMEDSTCVGSVSKPDEPGEQFSAIGKDLVDQLPQIDSTPQNGELGGLLRNESCYVTGLKEDIDVVNTPEENKSFNDSASPEPVQVNPSATFMQHLGNNGELNSDVSQRAGVSEKNDAQIVGAHRVQSKVLSFQTCEGHLDDNDAGNTSSLRQKVDPMRHVSDLSSNVIFTPDADKISECEHIIMSKSTEAEDQFIGNLQEASFIMGERQHTFVTHSAAVSTSATEVISMHSIDHLDRTKGYTHAEVVDKQENLLENVDNELDERISASNTEKLLLNGNIVSHCHANEKSSDRLGHSSNLVVEMCSSSGITRESQKHEDIKDRHDDSMGVHAGEVCSSSYLLAESQKRCDQMFIECAPSVHLCSPDASVPEKKAKRFPTESGIQHEDSEPPSHIHNSLLVKQEETATTISSLDAKQSSQVLHECSSPSSLVKSQQTCDQILIETGSSFVHLCSPDASAPEKVGRFSTDSESTKVVPEIVNTASNNILDSVDNLLLQSNAATDEAIQLKEDSNFPEHVHDSCLVNEEKPVTRISVVDAVESQVSHECSSYLLVNSQLRGNPILGQTITNVVDICQIDASASENMAGKFVTDSDEVLQCKEKSHSPSEADVSHVVKQEETLAIKLDSKQGSQVSDEWAPSLESKHGEEFVNSEEMPMEVVGQSSSSMQTSAKMCQNVPESDVAIVGSQQQCTKGMEEFPFVHDVDSKEKECIEVCKMYNNERVTEAEGKSPIHEETFRHPLPSSVKESSHDIGVKDREDYEASEINIGTSTVHASPEGLSRSGCNSTLGPAVVSQGHVVEVESNIHHPNEPNCGSPTVISCNEVSQSEGHQERNMGSLNHIDSGALEQDVKEVGCAATNHKEKDAVDGDRSFTFKVTSLVDLSEKESENGWTPFPSVQTYGVQQAQSSSGTQTSGFCDMEPKKSEDISHGSPRVSAETDRCASFNCDSEDKEMLPTQKTSERETVEERKPQNDELLNGKNKNPEGVRRLDPNTIVSGYMEEVKSRDRKVAFEVNPTADHSKEENCKWKPVHNVQQHDILQMVDTSPNAKAFQEVSHEDSPRTSGAMDASQGCKGNVVGRTKSSSGKAAVKGNNKEGKVLKKTISMKHAKAGGTSPASMSQIFKTGEVQDVGRSKGISMKPSVIATGQASYLPDMNSLTSSYTFFQQPFTDFQQLQLRAQIFVYGSIIQGATPDEACMLAAFGESDGGKRAWETVWRVAVEKFRNQQSPLSNAKTPVHPHPGARAPEATRLAVRGSEAVCTSGGAESNKLSSVVFNRSIPFSSPIWTISTTGRDQLLPSGMPKGPLVDKFHPLQNSQSPHLMHYIGNTTPWLTQVPSPGAWVVTQNAAVDASVQNTTLPICETVRVTSIRESYAPHCSTPPSPLLHTVSPSSGVAGKSLAKVTTVSPAKHSSSESKPRKKRKNVASEASGRISSLAQPWRAPGSVTTQSPTSVAAASLTYAMNNGAGNVISGISPVAFEMNVTAQPTYDATTTITSTMNVASGVSISSTPPSSVMNATAKSSNSVSTTTVDPTMHFAMGSLFLGNFSRCSTHGQILGGGETEQRVMSVEEMCGRIEQAKRHAEDAAALAATAVQQCQKVWSQLTVQKNSGVVSSNHAKLESSAVAIAAAASVAKAAASVAKVASDAALQAKLMADEALVTTKSGDPMPEISFHNDVKKLGTVTPILEGRGQNNIADSALVAIRESANKRVEAASAATKRAENLDAVLKAAAMTAEAVSQAGAIVAMGEPLPFTLTELIDAGPEGYWKAQKKSSEQPVKSNNIFTEQIHKDGIGSVYEFNELSNRKEAKTIGTVPESQLVSENASITIKNHKYEGQEPIETSNGSNFVDGSVVEVRSDMEGLRTVWFSAKVLSSKDGKVLVSYGEHAHQEGSSQPTEWVTLDSKEGDAPRVRIPHPMSVLKHDRTKKRSRTARGDYMWSVGDKVDAWIRNGWWEGILTEENKEDETSFTIHFPAQKETSVVKVWNIRPSLIWENGRWIEWCHPAENNCLSHEGKPPKKGRLVCETDPVVEVKGKDKMTKLPSITEVRKMEAHKPLILSANEKVFNTGKITTKDALGRKLTGLQKEGSKRTLGTPNPGKKRKFIDVSKVSKTMPKIGKPLASTPFPSRNASDSLASKKKSSSDLVANMQSKGKSAPLGAKFVKNNEKGSGHDFVGNFTPSSVEPRRSIRKIQPTSRLLEGLQSSLIVSRIPSSIHDRSTKTQQRNIKRT